jgi:RNA polymerase sigma-70 factor (ECF subfamily)
MGTEVPSPSTNNFLDLIRLLRAGDAAAAVELVRRYEPALRRAVRLQLRDPRLRRVLDSSDICQSVLTSFFRRVALAQYRLDTPEQLSRLLLIMARNKLVSQARKPHVVRRARSGAEFADAAARLRDPHPTPSQQAARQDLVQQVRRRLSVRECQLAERRAHDQEWSEIADELGGTPEALRKQLARALERVARQMGLEEWNLD